jgi:hypothetical protein
MQIRSGKLLEFQWKVSALRYLKACILSEAGVGTPTERLLISITEQYCGNVTCLQSTSISLLFYGEAKTYLIHKPMLYIRNPDLLPLLSDLRQIRVKQPQKHGVPAYDCT